MNSTIKLPITDVYEDVECILSKKIPMFTTLIIIHSGVEAYHVKELLQYNDDTDVYIISDIRPDIPGIWGGYKWKASDVLIREWFLKNKDRMRTNKLLYMEYDVLVTTKITDSMFTDGVRTSSTFNRFTDIPPEESWKEAGWWWSVDGDKLPFNLKRVATATIHTIMWFSFESLTYLILPEWDDVFSEDIISEIRLPTILNYHKVPLYDWDANITYMRNWASFITTKEEPEVVERIRNTEPGIYHPIKEPVDVFLAKQGDSLE